MHRYTRSRGTGLLGLAALLAGTAAMSAASAKPATGRFVTLGTMGGPVPDGRRSQPANVLIRDGRAYLVDVGDGAAEQLAKSGIALPTVKAVFLSHLHIDHVGGLAAILGLRMQTEVREMLTIYGPPGTRELVAGLVAAFQPAAKVAYGMKGQSWPPPETRISVIELGDGETMMADDIRVTAAQNTHYDYAPGTLEDRNYKSLSLRFDMPGRSIVYTGDTGPSPAVEKLAVDADLLVSEMIDLDATMARVARNSPAMSAEVKERMVHHLTTHHLTPEEVGILAGRARVKSLVITHFAGGVPDTGRAKHYVETIRAHYKGPVKIAEDLDRF